MALDEWKQKIMSVAKDNFSSLLPKRLVNGNIVGLDINADSLKLLKINSAVTPYRIENFAIAPLPSGSIVKDEIRNDAVISDTLREMFKESGIQSKDVALAIPRSLAIIKNISIDSRLRSDEIESRAWIEANRHFPDLVGNIHLDFAFSGSSSQDASMLEVVLVACRKDQIKPYVELLKQAGLNARIVDINCYALERALPLSIQATNLQTVALLNINAHLSTFIVVHDGILIHAHDQSYDGLRLMNQTTGYLKEKGINETTAAKILLEDMGYSDILKENLTSHLRHTLHFFYSSRPNISIQQISLAGDCATLPALAPLIQGETGIETFVANPFANLTLSSTINEAELKIAAPSLMLCCGLALSKTNPE